jgi:hypothetical protein
MCVSDAELIPRWLTTEQRAALQQKEAKIRAAQEEAKRTRTMTIDFAGRRGFPLRRLERTVSHYASPR